MSDTLLDEVFTNNPELVNVAANRPAVTVWQTLRQIAKERLSEDENDENAKKLSKVTQKEVASYVTGYKKAEAELMRELTKVVKPKYDQIVAKYPWRSMQCDLFVLNKNFRMLNKGVQYFLTAIDVFSRYVWIVPMKRKDGPSTRDAFEALFDIHQAFPERLVTDAGNEFANKHVQELFKERNIQWYEQHVSSYITTEKHHVPLAERFHRDLRRMIEQIINTHGNTRNAILDNIQVLIDARNNAYHTGAKGIPSKLIKLDKFEDADEINEHLIMTTREPLKKLPIGTTVRIQNFVKKGEEYRKRTQRWSISKHKITGYSGLKYILDDDPSIHYMRRELLEIS